MRPSRAITWAQPRVYCGTLLLVLFVLGAFSLYASLLASGPSGHRQADLRTLGATLLALPIVAAVVAAVLKKRLSREE
jgi:hypothetical protein